jgi:nitroreductase
MQLIDLLPKHRSIRKFTDEAIEQSLLERILLAGQSAATSSFVQAFSLIRITDSTVRRKLAQLSGNQPYVASCAEFFVCCADLARNRDISGETDDPGYMEQLIIATVDTALVGQNMVVAAESVGLGTCFIGGIRNNPQEVSDLLDLPDFTYPVFGLCLGYPAHDPETKPRLPQSIWVKENTYQITDFTPALEEHDLAVRNYYKSRTGNKKTTTWTEQMQDFLKKESRPHMLEFLRSRGLAKR